MAFDGGQMTPESKSETPAARATRAPASARRSDLDWLRVIAFGLLILFHAGLVYAPFDWHIHSRYTADWMRQGILLTGPWRLTLLFFISGAALKLMSRKQNAGQVLKARIARLVPPALFGVFILVPPQAFLEAVDKGSWHDGFFAWWVHQFSPAGVAAGVPVNHIWFVLYILVYSLLATALVALPILQTRLSNILARRLTGLALLAAPIAYLTLARQVLFLRFGISNHLSSDWYNHAVSLGAFLLGFLLVGQSGFWKAAVRWRWMALAVVAIALPSLIVLESGAATEPEPWWTSLAFSADQWATIAAILGFGAVHLQNRDGPILRYLAQAVFPCYLAHQTILVWAVWAIRPLNLPSLVEAPSLVAITVGGCLGVYEVVRRINLLRPIWGLKPTLRPAPAPVPALRSTPPRNEPPTLSAEAA
jgi:peptidoglycan/LPS O-acetylase OafA/YrhL